MDDTVRITFMRHGRSRADDEMVHEGRYDAPLTDDGRAQVRSCVEAWKRRGIKFDLIVASPLARASESAQIVGEELDLPIEYDPDWMERDNGPLARLPFDVAKERFPRPDSANPFEPYVPSTGEGESGWDLLARAAMALQRVVRRGRQSSLVVAHGGILNAAMHCILGPPTTEYQRRPIRLRRCRLRTHLVQPRKSPLDHQRDVSQLLNTENPSIPTTKTSNILKATNPKGKPALP